MKISKNTVNILKNFSTINSNLVIRQGTELNTWATRKTIIAKVTTEESFPVEFGIYDLSEFLGAMSIFNDPDLEFSEKYVTISENGNSIKYYAADTSVLVYPTKEFVFPNPEIKFNVSADTIAMIMKTSSVLRAPDLAVVGDGSTMKIIVCDKKNPSSNSYTVGVSDSTVVCNVYLKIDNLKLIPGAYEVAISSMKVSQFKGDHSGLHYYVAVEQDSTFS